jgi:hypothetical protein
MGNSFIIAAGLATEADTGFKHREASSGPALQGGILWATYLYWPLASI